MNAKCKNETSKVKKCSNKNTVEKEHGVRKLKKLQSKEVKTVSNNNNCDEKITSNTGKKKIGQFEKRLREKEEKRRKRKILRHEKKAQRAMQEFSKHVTNIAKEMGYLPGKDSKNRYSSAGRHDVSSESSSSSYTSCSCSNSSSSSSYTSCSCSCSCSSCDTCSCNDSDDSYGTDEYSEFTVGSSSECGCGCDSSSTSESSSSD
ncbi:uncharacterized protein LOC143183284 [Calliopsis andreniformis]|uniref:uncharacterized protein LOC143183284 n=1 Tax=Calliopsis andreniformis TaxID=337506 RepID=UPI003FCCF749